jgi:hypothetical protein
VKTQIIQVNKNDDYISVCDKMSWSQTGRILLVWPNKRQVLNRRLELVMVKRHASRLGAQLALVTHDTEVRFIANQEGIPIFKDLRQAQNTHWRIDRSIRNTSPPDGIRPSLDARRELMQFKTQDWLQHPAARILLFGISVGALFMLGIFILPGATIFLTPTTDIQSMDLRLTADPSLEDINLSTGSLPTYTKEVIVEGHKNAATTGLMAIPDKAAKGTLQFTNISDREITIPVGTVVTTLGNDPIRFATFSSNDVVIKPGTSDDINAGSIAPGKLGNLPPNSLVAIEGNLGLDLTVTNPNATYGGTDASVSTPTSQDFRLLNEQLIKDLEQTALSNMSKLIPADDSLITPTLIITEILDETATPAIGEPGSQLSIAMRLRFESQVVSSEKLNNLITPILDANIPHGYTPIENSIILKQLTNPILGEEGSAYWTINAQRDIQADIVLNQIVNQISGKSTPQAIDQLNASLPLANEARIILAPKWWPRLPFLPMRIQVVQADT